MNIYLLDYNNYFNRILKKEDSIKGYLKYSLQVLLNTYIDPKNGVDTEIIVNYNKKNLPDYLVYYDPYNEEIRSRWFVLDASRTRSGQYRLTLRRDVVVDYYDVAMSADAYIEKGYVNRTNPLIFNQENRSFNQIKMREDKLWDATKCAWVVGYYDAKQKDPIAIEGSFKIDSVPSISTFPLLELITDSSGAIKPGTQTVAGPLYLDRTSINFNMASFQLATSWLGRKIFQGFYSTLSQNVKEKDNYNRYVMSKFNGDILLDPVSGNWSKDLSEAAIVKVYNNQNGMSADNVLQIFAKYNGIDLSDTIPMIEDMYGNISNYDLETIKSQGTLYQTNNGKYYRITFERKPSTKTIDTKVGAEDYTIPSQVQYVKNVKLYNYVNKQINKFAELNGFNVDGPVPGKGELQMKMIDLYSVYYDYTLNVEEVQSPGQDFSASITANSNSLKDAPYKMFCFPYNGKTFIDNTGKLEMDATKSLDLATAMQKSMQTILYDIQLLPYCPIANWFVEDGYNTLKKEYDIPEINYTLITETGKDIALGAIYFPKLSRFSLNIPFRINTSNITDDYKFKVERETTLYRLVSPNFSNFQSFDPYMNNGVDFFNVDCTYKPITPYIKLNINYKYLYGNDYDDDRGLILGGDFSLPILTNEWKQYEIQNKNYSNIFDRQQEHLKTEHKYSMVGAGIGAISGAANAAAGAQGGPAGMALASGQSLVGSAFNMAMSQVRFNEGMNYNKDMFEFNLQNIQARPQGLVRTSAFNYNNKLVPFVEMYDCTDKEKENLYNKLKFNGMLVEAIGRPIDYINPKALSFLKCQIIRFHGLQDDNHIATTIASELAQGIYYQLEEEDNGEK